MSETSAEELRYQLLEQLEEAPYPASRAAVCGILFQLYRLYHPNIPRELRGMCEGTLSIGREMALDSGDSARSRMSALWERWDLWYESSNIIPQGLSDALMAFMVFAAELGEVDGEHRYMTTGYVTSPLFGYPDSPIVKSESATISAPLFRSIDSEAGKALAVAQKILQLAIACYTRDEQCDPEAIYTLANSSANSDEEGGF